MKTKFSLCVGIALFFSAHSAVSPASPQAAIEIVSQKGDAKSVEEIRKEIELFRQAILHKDMRGVTRYYWNSPELVVFDVITPLSYVGWESFRKDWEGFFVDFQTISAYDWNNVAIEASENLGYLRAFIHMKGRLNNGELLEITVRDTAIFRKVDGQWKVIHDHGSVPFDSFQTRRAVIMAPAS